MIAKISATQNPVLHCTFLPDFLPDLPFDVRWSLSPFWGSKSAAFLLILALSAIKKMLSKILARWRNMLKNVLKFINRESVCARCFIRVTCVDFSWFCLISYPNCDRLILLFITLRFVDFAQTLSKFWLVALRYYLTKLGSKKMARFSKKIILNFAGQAFFCNRTP